MPIFGGGKEGFGRRRFFKKLGKELWWYLTYLRFGLAPKEGGLNWPNQEPKFGFLKKGKLEG